MLLTHLVYLTALWLALSYGAAVLWGARLRRTGRGLSVLYLLLLLAAGSAGGLLFAPPATVGWSAAVATTSISISQTSRPGG